MTTTTIHELLDGCTTGRVQSVGRMQVVPLLDGHDAGAVERFVAPPAYHTSTREYGTLRFENPHPTLLLVPCHAGFVVRQAAQDHAMAHAALVAPGDAIFDTALCVQQTQGGMIVSGGHEMVILPLSLRPPALRVRAQREFQRLWPQLAALNDRMGLGASADLRTFLTHFTVQLDRFVAKFEREEGQVGTVVLVDGQVLGIERAPSPTYWQALWAPLLRGCYGAEVVRRQHADQCAGDPLRTRAALGAAEAGSLADVAAALRAADAAEQQLVEAEIGGTRGQALEVVPEQQVDTAQVETVLGERFCGQLVHDRGQVMYASLVAAVAA
jgi:hypothetical protein